MFEEEKFCRLKAHMKAALETIKKPIGKKEVTNRNLEFAAFWNFKESVKEEVESDWNSAFEIVDDTNVSASPNIVTSRIVSKIKENKSGIKALKSRLCQHESRDTYRYFVRKNSVNAQAHTLRPLLRNAVLP